MFGTGAHAGSFAEDDPFGGLLSYVEENTDVPYTGLGVDDNAEASGVSIRTEQEMRGEETTNFWRARTMSMMPLWNR